jgi:single-strand DNA-binding protein
MYNKVILVGNLTRDVELKYTPTGTAIAKFGLATNRIYKDSVTGENKQETMFIDITVFGRSAEIANQYLRKGRRVLIEGRLVLDQWIDQSGQKRSKHSIVAEKVQFMESKQNGDNANGGGYNNVNYTEAKPQSQPQQMQNNQNTNIPSIDIDEEEIPF